MNNLSEFPGLTQHEVDERVLSGKVNKHKFETSRNLFTIVRSNVLTLFNGVVGSAFLVLVLLGQWQDALFGLAVIFNIAIGIVQEYRSKVILDRLSLIGQSPIRVRRNSESSLIQKEQLVVDDVLELSAGDQLPVDAIVIQINNLEVDESLLSGESDPVAKKLGDALLSGSLVLAGSALARVTKVGPQTYANELLVEARKFSRVSSEIRDSLDRIVKWITFALGPILLIVTVGQFVIGENRVDAIVRIVASVISMIPQGLVLITSIAFAISAIRLARGKVLLQELASVEGLARVDLVCFDKTGTLTSGKLQFHEAIELLDPADQVKIVASNWRSVLAEFAHQTTANATARSLQPAFAKTDLVVTKVVEFNSTTKFSSITTSEQEWFLGAPEMLTKETAVLQLATLNAQQGFRVLLLCVRGSKRTPVSLITLSEEINPQAQSTLAYFKEESVQVKVLSGDHPSTVASVARQAGMVFEGDGFDARELPTEASALASVLANEQVFGRVSPDQKKLIVSALQSSGNVVAMVGDGVNDALAIKQADIGIAMGSGSAATRAVANLTLMENNFAALPKVVGEGRQVIANVERLSRLFLTKTSWAMLLAIVFAALLWEFPFLPRQLSAVDSYTIGIPAFLLAFSSNPQKYQVGFLKHALAFCIPTGIITALGVISLAVVSKYQGTWLNAEIQTGTAIILSITGLWVLSTATRPLTRRTVLILLAMSVVAFGLFVIPSALSFFGFVYLNQDQLIIALLIASITAALIELGNTAVNSRLR